MPRFVILEHDHPELHWDLMLEAGERLRTWRLARPPEGGLVVPALAISDHRRTYLDYEGPVSGDRGTVRRWESGSYQIEEETTAQILLRLEGSRRQGNATLRRMEGECWVFEWLS